MWGRKIVYILLVIITSYIALMYESPVPGVFLAFELLLPIALFALTWYHKKNVKVTIGNGQQVELTSFVTILIVLCLYTIVFGRFFCGFACAFGSLGDYLQE